MPRILLLCHFEMPGLRGEEVEEQMYLFAEQVMPELPRLRRLARAAGIHRRAGAAHQPMRA